MESSINGIKKKEKSLDSETTNLDNKIGPTTLTLPSKHPWGQGWLQDNQKQSTLSSLVASVDLQLAVLHLSSSNREKKIRFFAIRS